MYAYKKRSKTHKQRVFSLHLTEMGDRRGEPLSELPRGGSTTSDMVIINIYNITVFTLSISQL
jgi:hypothetical protein